jgi:hypothetical protein
VERCWAKHNPSLGESDDFPESLTDCVRCKHYPVIGVILADNGLSQRPVQEDLFPLEIVARRAGLAIENATLHAERRHGTSSTGRACRSP